MWPIPASMDCKRASNAASRFTTWIKCSLRFCTWTAKWFAQSAQTVSVALAVAAAVAAPWANPWANPWLVPWPASGGGAGLVRPGGAVMPPLMPGGAFANALVAGHPAVVAAADAVPAVLTATLAGAGGAGSSQAGAEAGGAGAGARAEGAEAIEAADDESWDGGVWLPTPPFIRDITQPVCPPAAPGQTPGPGCCPWDWRHHHTFLLCLMLCKCPSLTQAPQATQYH